jgi:uncharacterized protein
MLSLDKYKGFDWDKGNIDKSYQKHGITSNEAEEVFLDEKVIAVKDIGHSSKEDRLLLVGKTTTEKILFVVFTPRKKEIKIVLARMAGKKEKDKYEKTA